MLFKSDKSLKDDAEWLNLKRTEEFVLRKPEVPDGSKISGLVGACKPLDRNSVYSYLLLCHHFAETCVVAEDEGEIVGFLSGYRPPDREEVFFVWQVAVDPHTRGRGLGKLLLKEALKRPAARRSSFLETTITPSNEPSRRLFTSLARDLKARCTVVSCFSGEDFGEENHEPEHLFRIGPFSLERVILL
jgi:L-2,4-diaminobutyric acid acetyltransferase